MNEGRIPLTEKNLRAILERDAASRKLVSDRGSKISRRHYALVMGYTPGVMTQFKFVFEEFEQRYHITDRPLDRLFEMKVFLQLMYDNGELGYRDKKVSRAEFAENFGLSRGSFINTYPEIRALFQEYDARAAHDGYVPFARSGSAASLKLLLTDQPILNRDGMTLNRLHIAQRLNLSTVQLEGAPFNEMIENWELKHQYQINKNVFTPILFGRIFSFAKIVEIWGEPFTRKVSQIFAKFAATVSQSTAKRYYLSVFAAFIWFGDNKSASCKHVLDEALAGGRVKSTDEWEDALFEYRDHLVARVKARTISAASCDNTLGSLRAVLVSLADGKVVPATSVPLPGIKNSNRLGGHLRNVAEAVRNQGTGPVQTDYVSFAQERLKAAKDEAGVDLCVDERSAFLEVLAAELRSGSELPKDPAAAVLFVLQARLSALRDAAENLVNEAKRRWDRGRLLLKKSDFDGRRFEDQYLHGLLNKRELGILVGQNFPTIDAREGSEFDRGLGNLLSLILQMRGGIPPVAGMSTQRSEPYGQFFHKRYLAYGGIRAIEPLLIPDADTVGAVLTLYLLESGSNVSVGRTLNRDCIEESDAEGHRRVTGFKSRAKGKPIIVDFPSDSAALSAMEWLAAVGEPLRERAGADADRLFLMRVGARVQLMTTTWYTSWFKEFADSVDVAKGLRLVPSMLRPSVLLEAALSNDGRIATGVALGQHSTTVSQGYQQKWPTRQLYDDQIRQFQVSLESLVLDNVEDAASKLGVTKEEFALRLNLVAKTGFGTFCRDRRGREEEREASCTRLDCWDNCPHMLIVAEIEAIAALQLWQASLRAVQPEWERDRSERWDEVWLPWLCLVDVVEEKMARGKLIGIWNAAQRRAAEISQQSGFVPPTPF